MMKKNFTVSVLVVMVSLLLSGCLGGSGSDEKAPAGTPPETKDVSGDSGNSRASEAGRRGTDSVNN